MSEPFEHTIKIGLADYDLLLHQDCGNECGHKEEEEEVVRVLFAAHKKAAREARREELTSILVDARGNEAAGYQLSKSWYVKRINDRLEELEQDK